MYLNRHNVNESGYDIDLYLDGDAKCTLIIDGGLVSYAWLTRHNSYYYDYNDLIKFVEDGDVIAFQSEAQCCDFIYENFNIEYIKDTVKRFNGNYMLKDND